MHEALLTRRLVTWH